MTTVIIIKNHFSHNWRASHCLKPQPLSTATLRLLTFSDKDKRRKHTILSTSMVLLSYRSVASLDLLIAVPSNSCGRHGDGQVLSDNLRFQRKTTCARHGLQAPKVSRNARLVVMLPLLRMFLLLCLLASLIYLDG